jgi:hypothetical protein
MSTKHVTHNIRETSLLSYDQLQEKLGEKQNQVITNMLFMYKHGLLPATDLEITDYIGFLDPNKVRPRRYELMKLGLVEQKGKKKCSISGKKALVWDLSVPYLFKLLKKGLLI